MNRLSKLNRIRQRLVAQIEKERARLFPGGATVEVKHQRYDGDGFVVTEVSCPLHLVSVRLPNGNIWRYETETVRTKAPLVSAEDKCPEVAEELLEWASEHCLSIYSRDHSIADTGDYSTTWYVAGHAPDSPAPTPECLGAGATIQEALVAAWYHLKEEREVQINKDSTNDDSGTGA